MTVIKTPALVLAAALLAAAAFAGAASAQSMAETQYMERSNSMKSMGGAVKAISDLVKAGGDASAAVAPAETIVMVTSKLPTLFPAGSNVDKSRALPAIWDNMDDVKSKSTAAQEAAKGLLAAAQGGNIGAVGQALGKMGQACGACHKNYRRPQ